MAHTARFGRLAAVLALPVAWLFSPVLAQTPPAEIHACVHKASEQVRFVAAGVACTQNETRVTFNTVGPKGDKGDKGDPGIQGPQGIQGPAGAKGDAGAGLDTGAIIGQAISCQGPLAGGMAYLAGHSFVAITGADGAFKLSHVPPGNYNLTIESASGVARSFPNVAVANGAATPVGALSIVDLSSDVANCGQCGRACTAPQVCTGGQCVLNCPPGTVNCSNVCTNLQSHPQNCGACGRACGPNQFCSNGQCTCAMPFRDCDGNPANGCEVNVGADPNHCGTCFASCQGAVCNNGQCIRLGIGSSCSSGAQCQSGNCLNGICQGTVSCTTCMLPTNLNTSCSFAPRNFDDPRCGAGMACDGLGVCKLDFGRTCTFNSQCASGNCECDNFFCGVKTCQ